MAQTLALETQVAMSALKPQVEEPTVGTLKMTQESVCACQKTPIADTTPSTCRSTYARLRP